MAIISKSLGALVLASLVTHAHAGEFECGVWGSVEVLHQLDHFSSQNMQRSREDTGSNPGARFSGGLACRLSPKSRWVTKFGLAHKSNWFDATDREDFSESIVLKFEYTRF